MECDTTEIVLKNEGDCLPITSEGIFNKASRACFIK